MQGFSSVQKNIKIIIICSLNFVCFTMYGQKEDYINGIDDYMAKTNCESIVKLTEQLDDEHHTFFVCKTNGLIYKIEGFGTGEFRAFKYEFYFRNDTLIYSYYFNKALKGHWSEFDDREYEYHEREEFIYYSNNQVLYVSGSDSELENQIHPAGSENHDTEKKEDIQVNENQIYCLDFAYELLNKFKSD